MDQRKMRKKKFSKKVSIILYLNLHDKYVEYFNKIIIVRFTEIERENRILLEKMSNIMQKGNPTVY